MGKIINIVDKLWLGHGRSMDFNRQYGKFQVKYPDGLVSQRFCWDVAKTYRKLFGGVILHVRDNDGSTR